MVVGQVEMRAEGAWCVNELQSVPIALKICRGAELEFEAYALFLLVMR